MDVSWLVSSLLAIAIGLSLGLLGGGGSILTVPALVFAVGMTPEAAVSTSLAVVGLNALLGTALQARRGNVNWRAAAFFGGAGIVGAYLGSFFTRFVPGTLLLVLFALLMLVVATMMLRPLRAGGSKPVAHWGTALGAGFGVGLLTGFLGVGGGFLIVPALVLLVGLSMTSAVATSLPIIALNSASGFLGHLSQGPLDWGVTLRFVALGAVGVVIGVRLANRVPAYKLRAWFAWFVIAVALYMLARTLLPLTGWAATQH
ncbi:MAG: sulfite exporter TauE/SafE family protein [Anaerolineae bacterium]|nr:sulfite exporter TauE/SafE family protein [Anaerolineae bacterium]